MNVYNEKILLKSDFSDSKKPVFLMKKYRILALRTLSCWRSRDHIVRVPKDSVTSADFSRNQTCVSQHAGPTSPAAK